MGLMGEMGGGGFEYVKGVGECEWGIKEESVRVGMWE